MWHAKVNFSEMQLRVSRIYQIKPSMGWKSTRNTMTWADRHINGWLPFVSHWLLTSSNMCDQVVQQITSSDPKIADSMRFFDPLSHIGQITDSQRLDALYGKCTINNARSVNISRPLLTGTEVHDQVSKPQSNSSSAFTKNEWRQCNWFRYRNTVR